jgi:RNA 2',3'-cyclic 3'-phosphodiesterase
VESIRTFVCIEIPEEIQDRLQELQRILMRIGAQVSWVKKLNIHLTLKFLGDVPRSRINSVGAAVGRAARVTSPFQIEVEGTGCFPSSRSPRVLWVGLGKIPHALRQLQTALESELELERFPRDPKYFAPHLTIGRLKSQSNVRPLVEALRSAGFKAANFRASEICVMRSDLRPTGSIYIRQFVIPLGGPSS